MANTFGFQAQALSAGLARAVTPLLALHLVLGAAVAALAGLGLGLWLKPLPVEMLQRGSTPPVTITAPQDDRSGWSQSAPASWSQGASSEAPRDEAPIRAELDQQSAATPEPEARSETAANPPLRLEDAEPRAPAQPQPHWPSVDGEASSPAG